ncbi:phenylalanine--tRNA ligase subunit alpha [Blattabacterium cuenoti]|uniref:phenylalanine--tRNA ligase subunit alpha n=1 Tax=Blattabacterium cuenoti TaxID=1653831 RepID=UPI00163C3C4D|nr:phenylalanine--tRNA ligase subunit alpha [Blattabacterium cuenoti]
MINEKNLLNNNETINKIRKEIKYFHPKTLDDLKKFKIKFFSRKKGIITILLKKIKKIPIYRRKEFGKIINGLKCQIQEKLDESNYLLKENEKNEKFDYTVPGTTIEIGSIHPISILKNRIINILSNIGFTYVDGYEIEDDWHNFTALNIPLLHPSRDMQDTFFLSKKKDILLRTHTSSIQIRYMENNCPPFRVLSIGKVYRNETISSHSNYMFHQAEGFYIDQNVSFSHLKTIIYYLINSIFGKTKIRFRSSYFPFTEPSAEVDIYYDKKWLEIMGCGIIDPKVLENVNIDPKNYSGFAFGLGIERIALILYGIKDIRLYFNNDIRFLKQFKSEFF